MDRISENKLLNLNSSVEIIKESISIIENLNNVIFIKFPAINVVVTNQNKLNKFFFCFLVTCLIFENEIFYG